MKLIGALLLLACLLSVKTFGQTPNSAISKDSLILAAREIMKSTNYCALVTLDETGQPQVRTMNPFPLGDSMVIWFATARKSRKVAQIKKDPRVCVYYADHMNAQGYVTIIGTATVIDDIDLLVKMKRDYWEKYVKDWKENFVLIKIIPKSLDVTNYKHNLFGDSQTSRTPNMDF